MHVRIVGARLAALVIAAALGAACGSDAAPDSTGDPSPASASSDVTDVSDVQETSDAQRWPDVIDATATFDGATWTIAATLSSPYDTPERYADSWRVVGPEGTVYGERFLTHDHQNEQPFTRSTSGVVIPAEVDVVTIEGRDQVHGWGGGTFELRLDR